MDAAPGPEPGSARRLSGEEGLGPISIDVYRARYTAEMESQKEEIARLAEHVDRGETITLLCSEDCVIAEACHRTVLAELIEAARKR